MSNDIRLGKYTIGPDHEPFIIAEMSGNHNQSLEKALQIVDAAAETGAHALKIQTYTADTLTIDCNKGLFQITDKKSLWSGTTLYELYKKAYTPWEWHEPIFKRCQEKGIIGFSTPFDETAVDYLEKLDVPFYKIASFENEDHGLLRKVASTGKPVIMSSGLTTLENLIESVKVLKENGAKEIVILKCTSSYPASPVDSNLHSIPYLKEILGCQIGLSDHTLGIGVAVASVALGATVIEKHFILSRAEGGVDSAFSLEVPEMRDLVKETKAAWQALGHFNVSPAPGELSSLQFKRSLYFVKDLKKGDKVTSDNLRSIRPGGGLAPKFLATLMGRTLSRNVERGTPVSWDDFTE